MSDIQVADAVGWDQLPRDVLDDVIPSFFTEEEIVQRRWVDSASRQRYLQLLHRVDPNNTEPFTPKDFARNRHESPWLATRNEHRINLIVHGARLHDEPLIFDLLGLTGGDLLDSGSSGDDVDETMPTLQVLGFFVRERMTQKFASKLVTLPGFTSGITMNLDFLIRGVSDHRRLMANIVNHPLGDMLINDFHLHPWIDVILYYGDIRKYIFDPWLRQHQHRVDDLLTYVESPEIASMIISSLHRGRVEYYDALAGVIQRTIETYRDRAKEDPAWTDVIDLAEEYGYFDHRWETFVDPDGR